MSAAVIQDGRVDCLGVLVGFWLFTAALLDNGVRAPFLAGDDHIPITRGSRERICVSQGILVLTRILANELDSLAAVRHKEEFSDTEDSDDFDDDV